MPVTHPSLVIEEAVREVLAYAGKLAADPMTIDESANLYDAGLTSHSSVRVMVALEDTLDIEFPEHLLRKSTFSSIEAIKNALAQVDGQTR